MDASQLSIRLMGAATSRRRTRRRARRHVGRGRSGEARRVRFVTFDENMKRHVA